MKHTNIILCHLMFFLFLCSTVHAAKFTQDNCIKALIGEAIGQSDEELQAHAYALKNRGTLRGVYGLHATHTPNPTADQWQRASNAWWAAYIDNSDPLEGRTEWRSDYDLKLMAKRGETPDSMGLYKAIKIGETTFYKLRGGDINMGGKGSGRKPGSRNKPTPSEAKPSNR